MFLIDGTGEESGCYNGWWGSRDWWWWAALIIFIFFGFWISGIGDAGRKMQITNPLK